MKVKGEVKKLDTLYVDSSIDLDNISIAYKDIVSHLDGSLQVSVKSGDLFVKQASINVDNIPLSLSGRVREFSTSPALDIRVAVKKAQIDKLQAMAAPFVQVRGLGLSGHIATDLAITGNLNTLSSMQAKGFISLHRAGVSYNDITAELDGRIDLNKSTCNSSESK